MIQLNKMGCQSGQLGYSDIAPKKINYASIWRTHVDLEYGNDVCVYADMIQDLELSIYDQIVHDAFKW